MTLKLKSIKMKKSNIIIITLLFCMLSLDSCKKNNDSNNTIQTQIQTSIQSGNWRITKFIDSGIDETTHFTGYNFTFSNSGILNAGNGVYNYTGTWAITDNNSNDDTQNDLHFVINFNLTNDFLDLNDDWDFVSQAATKIELIDVSGGNGGIDYLTFEKN